MAAFSRTGQVGVNKDGGKALQLFFQCYRRLGERLLPPPRYWIIQPRALREGVSGRRTDRRLKLTGRGDLDSAILLHSRRFAARGLQQRFLKSGSRNVQDLMIDPLAPHHDNQGAKQDLGIEQK